MSIDKCRSCFHTKIWHERMFQPEPMLCGHKIIRQDSLANCGCEEYIPENNLEYLEYLYDKKIM